MGGITMRKTSRQHSDSSVGHSSIDCMDAQSHKPGNPGPTVPQPSWFSPLRLLLIFCTTNLVVYLDRGLISSNGVSGSGRTEDSPQGSGIQGDFDLTYFQIGLLPAAFMIGLLLSSPVFAEVCKQYSAFRLLGIGMGVWSLAVILCGVSPNFWTLMVCRVFVGVGEASFVALAAPFIDDYAPEGSKAKWFGLFYLCIPVGFALGYIVGGLVAPALGWRAAFFIEGSIIIPFVIFALRAQPLHLQGTHDQKQIREAAGTEPAMHETSAVAAYPGKASFWAKFYHSARAVWSDVRIIISQKVWVLACIAYTLYVAVLGVYAYWGPKAGKALFFPADSGGQEADLVFGGVTVVTGVLGSILGGVLLDKMGDTLRLANTICGMAALLGVLVLIPAFTVMQTFEGFMVTFAIGQLLIFMLQAPVVAIQMWCVPQSLRALGASLTTVSIHLLGDVPSPPLLGAFQTYLAKDKTPEEAAQMWRVSMSLMSALLVLSGVFFLFAARASLPTSDYRQKKEGVDAPLLDADDVGTDEGTSRTEEQDKQEV